MRVFTIKEDTIYKTTPEINFHNQLLEKINLSSDVVILYEKPKLCWLKSHECLKSGLESPCILLQNPNSVTKKKLDECAFKIKDKEFKPIYLSTQKNILDIERKFPRFITH